MQGKHAAALVILLVGIILQLITPLYNRVSPDIAGLPFFYWFQTLLLLIVTFMYVGTAYLLRSKEEEVQEIAKGESS